MFPLSSSFEVIFSVSAFWVLTALCILGAERRPYLIALPVIVVFGIIAWKVSDILAVIESGLGAYLWIGALFISAGVFATWMVVVILGFEHAASGTRFDPVTPTGRWVRAALAILPAIVVTVISFEIQFVPDAKCANESITFRVGAQDLTFGPEFKATIKPEDMGSKTDILYSLEPKSKGALKKLCDASDNGHSPLSANRVLLSSSNLHDAFDRTCHAGDGPLPEFCKAYSEGAIESISMLNVHASAAPWRVLFESWFRNKESPRLFKGGVVDDGFFCSGEDTDQSIRCAVRRPLGAGSSAIVEGYVKAGETRLQTVERLNIGLDFLLRVFAG